MVDIDFCFIGFVFKFLFYVWFVYNMFYIVVKKCLLIYDLENFLMDLILLFLKCKVLIEFINEWVFFISWFVLIK